MQTLFGQIKVLRCASFREARRMQRPVEWDESRASWKKRTPCWNGAKSSFKGSTDSRVRMPSLEFYNSTKENFLTSDKSPGWSEKCLFWLKTRWWSLKRKFESTVSSRIIDYCCVTLVEQEWRPRFPMWEQFAVLVNRSARGGDSHSLFKLKIRTFF